MSRAAARRGTQRRAARRTRKAGRVGRKGLRRWFTWRKLLGYAIALCAATVGAFVVLYLYVDVPEGNAAATLQSNVYMTKDGKVLARTGKVNRESVPLEAIPEAVRRDVLAAENKDFYSDSGVSLSGTVRGLVNTALGRGTQGGSTITQQYVKNFYLSQEQTVTRKAKELVISLKVDREKSKDEILAGYLNTSYFGRRSYGVQAAARAYYKKDVKDLTVAEGAYLAALLQAPGQYDWATATDTGKARVQERWNYVLDNMVKQGWLDKGARDALTFPVPKPPEPAPGLKGQTGYLIDAADKELHRRGVDEQELDAGGWTITLTVDPAKQKALEAAVQSQLTSKLNPGARAADRAVQAGAVSLDPKTGKLLALYGGTDYLKHYVNNASRQDFQPASTFKPLILAAAVEHHATAQDGRRIDADTVYDGTNKRPVRGSSIPFAPENEDHKSYGQISVQSAMDSSVNSVFAQMAVDVGLDRVRSTATGMGMSATPGFTNHPAISLGSMGASPLDMAAAYATLDNHGQQNTPTIVESVKRASGKDPGLGLAKPGHSIGRDAADTVTYVLSGVVDNGSGKAVRDGGFSAAAAGKTGTSDDDKSAWYAGYTPQLVTVVGLFGEGEGGRQVTLNGLGGGGRAGGGGYPAKIWTAYTKEALGANPTESFDLKLPSPPPAPTPTPSPAPSYRPTTPTPTPSVIPSAPRTTAPPSSPTPSHSTSSPPTPDPHHSSKPPKPTPSDQKD
ncbi:transglycosylase domain-containing protein [Streptomyces sp. NPDC002506]|uniref:transglycosylase domain-containing protein n=1 Tax=Streptomyces sp. NPDC002506 TaxID=3154536 RepID=UPI0033259E81